MIKALVVDDVKAVRDTVVQFLNRYSEELTVIAEADSVASALEQITKYQPDAIFLDIEMKDGTGFDLLKQLPIEKYKIVFITAYNHYATKAFKYSAIDYILKPIDPDELKVAIQKLKDVITKDVIIEKYSALFSNLNSSEIQMQKIILKTVGKVYSVYIKDIIRCESESNYTYFYLSDNTKILVSVTLKEYEELLSEHGFFRIHQSHLINLNFFNYIKKEGLLAVMKDSTLLPIASRKKNAFIQALESVKK